MHVRVFLGATLGWCDSWTITCARPENGCTILHAMDQMMIYSPANLHGNETVPQRMFELEALAWLPESMLAPQAFELH